MELPSQEIISRALFALEDLKQKKEITGVREFCEKYDFARKKFSSLKKPAKSKYKGLDMQVYFVLARDFKISLDWLFFNAGPMYRVKNYVYHHEKAS